MIESEKEPRQHRRRRGISSFEGLEPFCLFLRDHFTIVEQGWPKRGAAATLLSFPDLRVSLSEPPSEAIVAPEIWMIRMDKETASLDEV